MDDTPLCEVIGNNDIKLNNDEAKMLEGEITYEELKIALKNMKNSKSPGNDGFQAELLFWGCFGRIYFKIGKYRHGFLSVTQTQGIITCLPKSYKHRNI